MPDPNTIDKQKGVTAAERYLTRLCTKSFLSLWSYPSIYRDQGQKRDGDGKEICDLLVVFGDDIIIFSDKDCRFPDSGRIDIDWARWFKRAVQASADQLWGAERWITKFSDRIFVDRRCSQAFPIPIPDLASARFHRIVVAHDASRRCRELMGGSGSLFIIPEIKGKTHVEGPVAFSAQSGNIYETWAYGFEKDVVYAKTVLPFAVGDVDPAKGFVHVFDDVGLELVMSELDTISDFVAYLTKRESYVRSGRLILAAGEDDLLANYLQEIDSKLKRSFHTPENPDITVIIPDGEWEFLKRDPYWIAKKKADMASYFWDSVIERFCKCILDGTSAAYPFADFRIQELAVRAIAGESRYHRRVLANFLKDFLAKGFQHPIDSLIVICTDFHIPCYVFLTVAPLPHEEYLDYRERRRAIAIVRMFESKQKYTDATHVVVLAMESIDGKWGTEDLLYRGAHPLAPEELAWSQQYVAHWGLLTKEGPAIHLKMTEFPKDTVVPLTPVSNLAAVNNARSIRNMRCPCGSGLKFKKCCIYSG